MVDAKAWVLENIDVVLLVVVALLVVVLVVFIFNTVRLNKMHKRYRTLMKGLKHANLEEVLFQYADGVHGLEAEVRRALEKLEVHQRQIEVSCGPVGVVRYNAFPDAGSDLSFSVAVLNRDADGVVFTSIFGREESRSYAKPILAGASTYLLSEEEKEAIQIALDKMKK
ncbi:MAG: DUF4446 family protein [Tumebacillaceae bacterium]